MTNAVHCPPKKHGFEPTVEKLISVLHVDDNENFQICFKRYLERQGNFKVENAPSAEEALLKIGQKRFDVIVSDQQMPKKTGVEFLKELSQTGNIAPFFLLTGDTRNETLREALESGAYRVFNKNSTYEKLYLELAHSIKQSVKIKKTEKGLKESEKKFRAITSSAKDGIILINEKGKIELWNPAAEEIFGYSKKDAIGKDLHILIAPTKFHKRYLEGFSRFRATGKGKAINKSFEFEGIKKDGKVVPIEVSLSAVMLKEKRHALAIVRDCTERKAAWTSLEQTIDELVKINEKLGVVGRLTRHDARNKLSVILNNIYLAKQTSAENPQQKENCIHEIESVVDQMTKIFDFASHYEKLGIEELTYNNVENRFQEAATLISGTQNIQFTSECPGLHVLADSLLRQLFYNLIHNSLTHGKKVSQIKIRYHEDPEQLQLVYEDNGSGIATDEKQKIFKEGYGKGTGFGLYLIKKICEAYNWSIQETGIPSKGAQFTISIPKENNEIIQL
jgi:PAS domain S-box-containing protein